MRRRLRHGRQKAPFGSQEAAILGAAAMNVAAIAAQAKMQKDATLSQAKTQAQSIKEQAKAQSEAISEQNENNTKLNEDMINANKELAAQQKAYQDTIQMNLQLQNGMQNEQMRMEESKMIVKNGGNLNKSKQSLLRGGNNIRFKLPRRGNVELVGVTPEGYNLYSIYGPSHKNGGVDIDFENGGKIEAEGDAAKTGRNKRGFSLGGEYMLTTPNDAFFISQHDINGFNPAEAVDNGMHPLQAFNIQEINKKKLGIKDDGSKKAMNGNSLIASGLISPGNPNFPNINDAAIFMNNNKRRLRNGGRVKAAAGTALSGYKPNAYVNFGAAGLTTLGNLWATLATNSANRKAGQILSDAYNYAGNTLSNAYKNLKTIDPNIISDKDFQAAYYIPMLRSARFNINPQLTAINRSRDRLLNKVALNSLSASAMNNRIAKAEIDANDMRMQAYAEQANREEQIKRENTDTINKAASDYASAQNRMLSLKNDTKFNIAKYNTDVKNEGILGSAEALSQSRLGAAGALTQAEQSIGTAWGNFASNLGQTAGNALTSYANQYNNYKTSLAMAENPTKINLLVQNNDKNAAQRQYDTWMNLANDSSLNSDVQDLYRKYATELDAGFNGRLNRNNSRISLKTINFGKFRNNGNLNQDFV